MASTIEEAHAEGNEGIYRADSSASEAWKQEALAAIWTTCVNKQEFHVDSVWEVGNLSQPPESRALGQQMRLAARKGWCEKTDRMLPSIRSHGSGKPVWRSLVYKGDD